MLTVSILYRCLITSFLFCWKLLEWSQRWTHEWILRHGFTVRVNVNVIRHPSLLFATNDAFPEFNKPTKTVALIINERIPDAQIGQVIVNSIFFFRRMKVQHLIIYDYQGYVKRCEPAIMDYLLDFEKKNQSSCPLPTLHFESLLDSSQTLARVAQNLCEQVQLGELKSDSIQTDTVDRCYSKLTGLDEINLAIIVGPISSALGLHPWLTRLTEFIMIDSYHQLQTTDAFRNIVQRYNRIEQRVGR